MQVPTPQEIIDRLSGEVERLKDELSKENFRNISVGFNSDGGAYWEGESWKDGKKVGLTGSYYNPVFFQAQFTAPSSTTNDREIARTIKLNNRYGFDECGCSGDDVCGRHQAIAAALAEQRREALERSCACVCKNCLNNVSEIREIDGYWYHYFSKSDALVLCDAAAIRAEMDKP